MRGRSENRPWGGALKALLGAAVAAGGVGCAQDRRVRIEPSYLAELSASADRQGELAGRINGEVKGKDIQIVRRDQAGSLAVRSLTTVTAESVSYALVPHGRASLPLGTVREIRIREGSQASRGALVGALIGAGAMVVGAVAASDRRQEVPTIVFLPVAMVAGAGVGALYGLLFGSFADRNVVYELPAPTGSAGSSWDRPPGQK